MKRAYELRQRAEQVAATRRRIVEATVELHRTVGPAETHVSEIARRAGVQRATVYNHFRDESSLLAACSSHWRSLHPAPDPAPWSALDDAGARLRLALRELYEWYRATEPMTANVLRDQERLPALRAVIENGLGAYLAAVGALLAAPFAATGRRAERIDAALRVALGFPTWRALAPLGDAEAAELAALLVEQAAAKLRRESSGSRGRAGSR